MKKQAVIEGPRERVAIDIETMPLYEGGSGLNPEEARVESCGFYGVDALGESVEIVRHIEEYRGEERELLIAVAADVARFAEIELIGWNTSGFDLPFLQRRYSEYRLDPLGPQIWSTGMTGKYGSPEYDGTWHKATHRDIWREWAPYAEAAGISSSLKPVSRACGIEVIEIDTTKLGTYSTEEVRAYQLSDVVATYTLDQIPVEARGAAMSGAAA